MSVDTSKIYVMDQGAVVGDLSERSELRRKMVTELAREKGWSKQEAIDFMKFLYFLQKESERENQ